ncbi:hypothetical protein HHUSO_G19197 [Huso huso]|uniref:IF rod domain-containing protein n=1 Tax=Huso huso TaxID=61971 RepID=A0ABR0Z5X9_HUSHU
MSRAGFTEGSATRHRRVDIRSRERETGKRDTISTVGATRPAEVEKLLGEFQELYQDRLRRLDQSGDGREETLQVNLGAADLSEQNQVLIQTLEELEMGSEQRVNSLERELEEYACRLKENDQEKRTLRSTQESLEQDIYVSSDLENWVGGGLRPSLALCPMPTEHLSGTTATIHSTQ